MLEQREPIAQAAFRRAREHAHGARFNLKILGFSDALDFAGNFFERERAEIEKAARAI